MPTRHRPALLESSDGKVVTTISKDGCLFIYPETEWNELERGLSRMPSGDPKVRDYIRFLLGMATDGELDGQNRLLIPPMLRGPAELDKHVVLVGMTRYFELWNEERWSQKFDRWQEDTSDPAELPDAIRNFSF